MRLPKRQPEVGGWWEMGKMGKMGKLLQEQQGNPLQQLQLQTNEAEPKDEPTRSEHFPRFPPVFVADFRRQRIFLHFFLYTFFLDFFSTPSKKPKPIQTTQKNDADRS